MSQLSLFGETALAEVRATSAKPTKSSSRKAIQKTIKTDPAKSIARIEGAGARILDGWNPEKQYYSIGEVAGLFKVNPSHIRFWTNSFKLKVRTTGKGDRLYKPEDVHQLGKIYHLVKEVGFTLAGAKAKIKEGERNKSHHSDLSAALSGLRIQLMQLREQLEK